MVLGNGYHHKRNGINWKGNGIPHLAAIRPTYAVFSFDTRCHKFVCETNYGL